MQNEESINIELVRVDSIVSLSIKPNLKIEFNDIGIDENGLREIEFKATNGNNLAFYSWDFNFDNNSSIFKPNIIRDTEGLQSFKFKPGIHNIAIKVIDNEGLESIEVIKLKINGDVKKI